MNFLRNILVILTSIIIGFFSYEIYENYKESEELNIFLEEASIISSLHEESSRDYARLINFDELNRDDFESTFIEIIRKAQEANNIVLNSKSSYSGSERELLEIATSSWLKGL